MTVLTFGRCGTDGGRTPRWRTRTGTSGATSRIVSRIRTRLGPAGAARGHQHDEITGREVSAPVEGGVVQGAGERAGVLAANPVRVFTSLTRKTHESELPEFPWKSRKRKSV